MSNLLRNQLSKYPIITEISFAITYIWQDAKLVQWKRYTEKEQFI